MASFNTLSSNAGLLYGLVVGGSIPFDYLPCVMAAPATILFLLSPLLVESPLWLMKKGRKEEAMMTLVLLRGTNYNMEPELKELENLSNIQESTQSKIFLMTERTFLIPMAISMTVFGLQVFNMVDVSRKK